MCRRGRPVRRSVHRRGLAAELPPNLAAGVLGGVHVDVRLVVIELRRGLRRHLRGAARTGGARAAERHDHRAGAALLPELDVRAAVAEPVRWWNSSFHESDDPSSVAVNFPPARAEVSFGEGTASRAWSFAL